MPERGKGKEKMSGKILIVLFFLFSVGKMVKRCLYYMQPKMTN